jgi:hypothetical protein
MAIVPQREQSVWPHTDLAVRPRVTLMELRSSPLLSSGREVRICSMVTIELDGHRMLDHCLG